MGSRLSNRLIVLVRHTETVANVTGVLVGRSNSPLTERGAAQVDTVADYVSKMPVARVYSSPMDRTLTLATAIADRVGSGEVTIDSRLHEIDFGVAEGMRFEDLPRGGITIDYDSYSSPIVEDGESRVDVDNRVHDFLAEVAELEGVTVVVSHGGPLRSALTRLLGLPPTSCWAFHIDNGAVMTVSMHEGTGILEELVALG